MYDYTHDWVLYSKQYDNNNLPQGKKGLSLYPEYKNHKTMTIEHDKQYKNNNKTQKQCKNNDRTQNYTMQ